MLPELDIGDVVGMTSCQILYGNPKEEFLRVNYKAVKGHRFVSMLLGYEPVDGSKPLDPFKRLNQLGWTNPDFPAEPEAGE